jgi:hypothetical protein
MEPWSLPEILESYPLIMGAHPEIMEAHPKIMEAQSETKEADLEQWRVILELLGLEPRILTLNNWRPILESSMFTMEPWSLGPELLKAEPGAVDTSSLSWSHILKPKMLSCHR